jgi:hypothetical protein
VVKFCCGKDLASLHGEGRIPAVSFAHNPVVPGEVQAMDSSKYTVFKSYYYLLATFYYILVSLETFFLSSSEAKGIICWLFPGLLHILFSDRYVPDSDFHIYCIRRKKQLSKAFTWVGNRQCLQILGL